ncbi:iron-containing alcohol dehydrogenase family protein [Thermotoga sp. KOL6]|uniref:iron-containing alcohol dehydrogenase family protein n=1 Tax=Thermotoga sp. KOL6 TaxID=126741 RepID=UPI000C784AAC|nr:iron-containing alcohol dehydrogenase family protein [Thermotoga sp. KOL6]PLV59724.1 alcohol dehydrogenase [Thermotoga sp. KOL6]
MWEFYMPTDVFFGEGVLSEKGAILDALGKRALIVTGRRSSKMNGSLDDLTDLLNRIGVQYTIFDNVEENPSFDNVTKAVEFLESETFDFVIGLGGGSPMDFAKAIAVLLKDKHLTVEDLYNKEKINYWLPVVAIPTTAGTGSEVTPYSILTDPSGNKRGCRLMFPVYAFLDPRYVYSMPGPLTLSTGVDALSHAVEGFLSKRATPPSDALSIEAMKIIYRNLKKAIEGDRNAREKMLIASCLAGMVIAQTGTTLAHAMGYHLTIEKGIKHGRATGIILPFVMETMKGEIPDRVDTVNKIFGGSLLKFLREVGLYEEKVIVTSDEIERWVNTVLKAKHILNTPGIFTPEKIKRIYGEALEV